MSDPVISVVLSTRNRAAILHETLTSFADQEPQSTANWQLIVVDNGSCDHTLEILDTVRARLPLTVLSEPCPGKARAINRALERVVGDLIIFTDDDVRASPSWLRSYVNAALEFQAAAIFCGPIEPLLPKALPRGMRLGHPYLSFAFAAFGPRCARGPMPRHIIPFGPNFAVRKRALQGTRLREHLGPSDEPLMNEDVEFLRRLKARSEIVFVPDAGVWHHVRPEQLRLSWVFERAFYLGRSYMLDLKSIVNPFPPTLTDDPEVQDFELGVRLNCYCGQLYQSCIRGDISMATSLDSVILQLGWSGDRDFLCEPVLKWLQANTLHIPEDARERFNGVID
jgi:glycosyltransferase involved in cell wall biosynthesis